MLLTDIKVQKLKPQDKPYKLKDGDGLFLMVHPNGGKYWRFRYSFAGKERELAMGTYPVFPWQMPVKNAWKPVSWLPSIPTPARRKKRKSGWRFSMPITQPNA